MNQAYLVVGKKYKSGLQQQQEGEITDLKKRVEKLENIIEKINEALK